jgi:hypothetical protein
VPPPAPPMDTSTKPGARIWREQQPMKVMVMAARARRRRSSGRSRSQRSTRRVRPRSSGMGARTLLFAVEGRGCVCGRGEADCCFSCPSASPSAARGGGSARRTTVWQQAATLACPALGDASALPCSLPLPLPTPPSAGLAEVAHGPASSCSPCEGRAGWGWRCCRHRRTCLRMSSGATWNTSSVASAIKFVTTTRRRAGTGGDALTCAQEAAS